MDRFIVEVPDNTGFAYLTDTKQNRSMRIPLDQLDNVVHALANCLPQEPQAPVLPEGVEIQSNGKEFRFFYRGAGYSPRPTLIDCIKAAVDFVNALDETQWKKVDL